MCLITESISEIGNLVSAAALAELYGKKGKDSDKRHLTRMHHPYIGLSLSSHASIITKQSPFGNSVDYSIDTSALEPTNITPSLLGNLKALPYPQQPVPGSFRYAWRTRYESSD